MLWWTLARPACLFWIMALAARQVQVAGNEDVVVAVEKNVVCDPATGRAVEVENVMAAVDLGDGNIGVARQQRVVGYQAVPPVIRANCTISNQYIAVVLSPV